MTAPATERVQTLAEWLALPGAPAAIRQISGLLFAYRKAAPVKRTAIDTRIALSDLLALLGAPQ